MNSFVTSDIFNNSINIPGKLFYKGDINNIQNKRITIVGSRRPSEYGKYCISKIIKGLSGYPISIISGLAIGVDSLAHEEALKNNIHTIAIPGSGLSDSDIYPKTNLRLANKILEKSGCLISPWENQKAAVWTFPVRNSIMAAISDIVIIIEGKEKSGTLITANEARKRNITICAIPGNIDNTNSSLPNILIKEGARLITDSSDILKLLNLDTKEKILNEQNSNIYNIILNNNPTCDELIKLTGLTISEINIELTMLEISGDISIDNNGIIRAIK